RQNLENEINGFVFDPVTILATAANMEGKSRRSGLEAGARWEVSETLAFNATYTYLESTAQDVREIRRPRHSGSFDLDYEIFSGRGRLVLAATYGGDYEHVYGYNTAGRRAYAGIRVMFGR
ncbi:MAG: TonB-dependent receptor, partial [Woeseiaceae bacterium]